LLQANTRSTAKAGSGKNRKRGYFHVDIAQRRREAANSNPETAGVRADGRSLLSTSP
jgi:hypothetical protein